MCHLDQGEKKKKHKLMDKTFHHMSVSGKRPLNSVCCPRHHVPWQHGGKAETKAQMRTPAPYTVLVSLGLRLLPCKKETTMLALHGSCKKQRRWKDLRAWYTKDPRHTEAPTLLLISPRRSVKHQVPGSGTGGFGFWCHFVPCHLGQVHPAFLSFCRL